MGAEGHPWTLSVHEYGDAGLLVHVDSADRGTQWAITQGLARTLRDARVPGLVDLVAAYADLFLAFDPLVSEHARLEALVRREAGRGAAPGVGREFLVPVVYGGEHGPDLDAAAADLGVGTADVVAVHSGAAWTVRFCGAPSGSPMMDGPRMPAPVPRRAEPRVRVETGSVAISGFQSMIYPVPSPGGWRLIGRTPARLLDPRREPIMEYRPGDMLRFVPVPVATWADWEGTLAEVQEPLRAVDGHRPRVVLGAGA